MSLGLPWMVFWGVLLVLVGGYGWVQWFKVFNSPDGERYTRWRTQGPMVPLSGLDGETPRESRKTPH
jgi:hypothetical protein